jgi:hypothetical protein
MVVPPNNSAMEKPFLKKVLSHGQHIPFNLIRQCGVTDGAFPTVKLFKSFLSVIRKADITAVILPFSPLSSIFNSE